MPHREVPATLQLGSTLLLLSMLGLLAAPITIARGIADLTTRPSRHTLAGVLALTAVVVLVSLLALIPVRRGERWAIGAAAVPFLVVGIPMLVVDATYVPREHLWNTLTPQVLGLLVYVTALTLCILGTRAARR